MVDNKEVSSENNTIVNEGLPKGNAVIEALPEEGTPILFSSSSSEWGDCEVQECDLPEKSCVEMPQVPRVLCDLFNNGAKYETASKFTWHLQNSERVRLRKELSVIFSIDTPVSSQEIIEGLDKAGIDVDDILSIQRRASSNSWCASFHFLDAKNMAFGFPSVEIAGCTVFLGDCENRVQLVEIYEAPTEYPNTALIGRLCH